MGQAQQHTGRIHEPRKGTEGRKNKPGPRKTQHRKTIPVLYDAQRAWKLNHIRPLIVRKDACPEPKKY